MGNGLLTYYAFASSSDGNAGVVTDGETHILLDAGISAAGIRAGLAEAGIDPGELSALLLTHTHEDHVRGLRVFLKKTPLPVLRMGDGVGPGGTRIGSIRVFAFPTPHDSENSCGYRFETGGDAFGFATDLGCVTSEVRKGVGGVRKLVLESNYDRRMLWEGPYPDALKRRIDSGTGHLSNADAAAFLREMMEEGLELAALGHLSRTNNTPELALAEARRAVREDKAAGIRVLERKGICRI